MTMENAANYHPHICMNVRGNLLASLTTALIRSYKWAPQIDGGRIPAPQLHDA